MTGSVAQDKKKSGSALLAAFLVGGAFFLAGAIFHFVPPPNVTSLEQQSGILMGASDSSRPIANNTTLTILDAAGEQHSYEIKSSIRFSAIREIRAAAREKIGTDVLYKANARTMYEMVTTDGTVLVSSTHVKQQRAFTGWGMGIGAMFFWGIAFVVYRKIR